MTNYQGGQNYTGGHWPVLPHSYILSPSENMPSPMKVSPTKKQLVETKVPTTPREMFFKDPHFKETWANFDKMKGSMENMLKGSEEIWQRMDDDFRNTRCMQPVLEQEAESRVVPTGERYYLNLY